MPEPTWTPAVVHPVGTPPPLPSPPPTPTPTPINPKESVIAAFDVPVGGLAVSPDDKTLAVAAFLEFIPEQGGNIVNQIRLIDLISNKVTELDVYGRYPKWSPDSQHILFETRSGDQVEIKAIENDGQEEVSITSLAWRDLLDYYWVNSDQIGVIEPNGINQYDLTGQLTKQVNLSLPTEAKNAEVKPKVSAHPSGIVVVADGQDLQVVDNEQTTRIIDREGQQRQITGFSLSPDGQRLAYIVDDGMTNDELWITNVKGDNPSQIYHVERGHIRSLAWSPDNKVIVVGWRQTGTSLGDELTLHLLNVENGQAIPLQVDNVDRGFVFSNRGDKLLYGRAFYTDPMDDGKTTLYQLEIKQ